VVQIIKSLQDPLEMGNNLPGSIIMSGNEAWNRNVLNADGRLTETGQISQQNSSKCTAGSFHFLIYQPAILELPYMRTGYARENVWAHLVSE